MVGPSSVSQVHMSMPVVRVSASERPLPRALARSAVDRTCQNLPRVVPSQPQGPLVSGGAGPAWRPSSRVSSDAQPSTTPRMVSVDLPVIRRGGRPVAPVTSLESCPAQNGQQPSSSQQTSQHARLIGDSMPVIRSGRRSEAGKPRSLHRSPMVAPYLRSSPEVCRWCESERQHLVANGNCRLRTHRTKWRCPVWTAA